MAIKGRLAAMLAALALAGCGGAPSETTGDPAGRGTVRAPLATAGAPPGTRVYYVQDPSLGGMNAFGVTIPADWKFDGTLYQGGKCLDSVPMMVYHATSPDGRSRAELLPRVGWQWGGRLARHTDCLPLRGAISAQDFLKYFAGTLKLTYVGPDPVSAEVLARDATHELAHAFVTFQQGTVAMRGRLDVAVECAKITHRDAISNKCTAQVQYFSAPEAELESVLHRWDQLGTVGTEQSAYQQAWLRRSKRQADAMLALSGQNTQRVLAERAARSSSP